MHVPKPAVRAAVSLALAAAVCAPLAAAGPAGATKGGSGSSTGTARVFMVNPVQSSGDQDLTDQNDSATAVPDDQYAPVQLRNLDGSGYLRGDWVNVQSSTGTPAFSSTNTFLYDRHQDQFEQVMAYFWVNQAQEYLQSLGFENIVHESFPVKINQYGGDNSYQTDKPFRVRLGKGGVDDAEDAEVIVHEYGHAVHASQVPGFGQSEEAGSIGEAWGDYFAVTVGLQAADQYGWPVNANPACPMDWDATSYTNEPHCIRRFDRNFTYPTDMSGEVHHDGQIWSQALWEIRQGYPGVGLTAADWDRTLVASQFHYAPDTSFHDAALATVAEASQHDGPAAAALVQDRFEARGIL